MRDRVINDCLSLSLSQVITSSGGNIYTDLNEEQKGRVSFASSFLSGDASLEISLLQPSDAGQYTCKVKNAGQYEWTHITLKVLGKAAAKLSKICPDLFCSKLQWVQGSHVFSSPPQRGLPNLNAGKKERCLKEEKSVYSAILSLALHPLHMNGSV